MRTLFFIVFLALLSTSLKAQTFDEWLRQKKTQKKYLLEQIAGLQVFIGYAQKGYSIARDGLVMIGDIKRGELNLHNDYFNSLRTVNPKIRMYVKIADIIAFQVEIIKVYKNTSRQVQQSKSFSHGELKYMKQVFSSLIDECAGSIDHLTMMVTSNQLEVKDDERLKRIDALYNDMHDKYRFAQSFAEEAKMLAASRLQDKKDIQTSRVLNAIEN